MNIKLSSSVLVLAALAGATSAFAQSADALIDKLVEKGILTLKEGNQLREESDKGFTHAYQVKSGMPDWVTSFRLNGDMRGRYDGIYGGNDALVDRNRLRYRLRFGATAVMKDNFEAGLRLTSADPSGTFGGNPISGNSSFQDGAAKKFIYIDLAYGRWNAVNRPDWTAAFTVGKMENPFALSDMVFDADYTPEGLAQQFAYNLNNDHSLKLNLGEFVLDELGGTSNDSYLVGAQLRLESKWSEKLHTSVGITGLAISGDEALATTPAAPYNGVANENKGNTRGPGAGALLSNYNPIVADAAVTYNLESFPFYAGVFPIKLAGDYMHNPGAASKNSAWSAGVTFGKSGKKGLWDLSYKYKVLEADSWYEEFVDSDYGAFYQTAPPGGAAGYGAGTNLRGHVIRAQYSPFNAFTFAITYYLAELIDESPANSKSQTGRIQVDAVWKF